MSRSEEELLGALRALPQEVPPPVDLWPAISEQIAPRRRLWPRAVLLAAAAMLLVASSSLTTMWLQPAPLSWEEQMVQASAQLEAELAQQDLDPATRARIQDNLATIDAAIEDIHDALRESPDDPVLIAALTTAHRHRLGLLRSVTTL